MFARINYRWENPPQSTSQERGRCQAGLTFPILLGVRNQSMSDGIVFLKHESNKKCHFQIWKFHPTIITFIVFIPEENLQVDDAWKRTRKIAAWNLYLSGCEK